MADLHPDNPYSKERFADPAKTVEFPPEAKKKFDWILTRYPTKEAALLPTLHLAQEVWGWISPEVVHYVGELLDLSPATVFGVVSFYNMYNQKPVGKYHLQVCTNLSCMVWRAYDIYEHLCDKLDVKPGEITRTAATPSPKSNASAPAAPRPSCRSTTTTTRTWTSRRWTSC